MRDCSGSSISDGNGPSPTRVTYAFATPMTVSMRVGPMPEPMAAPAAVGFDGDDVKLCYNPGEGDRPAKFDGSKAHLFVLKKAK